MPRSAPGPETGLPRTRTRPVVAGNCGLSPAMSRRMVDLPQPEGPRIVMNSPLFGRSSTRNVTFLIAVKPSSYVLETPSNSTTAGFGNAAGVAGETGNAAVVGGAGTAGRDSGSTATRRGPGTGTAEPETNRATGQSRRRARR